MTGNCKKCGYSLKRLMLMAMLMDCGASVSPSPLDCEHEFEEDSTDGKLLQGTDGLPKTA